MSSSVMQLVDRKLQVLEVEHKADMSQGQQTTADFFSVADRRELLKQGVQLEQILRDLGDVKASAKEAVRDSADGLEAHERRIRALEDAKLELRTQIATAAQTSRLWIVAISAVVGTVASFLVRLIAK